MRDAINARLATLSLSDVDFGEFSSGLPEREGVAREGARHGSIGAGVAGPDRLERGQRLCPDVDDRASALLVALRATDGEPPRAVAGTLEVGPGERGRLRTAEQCVTHRPAERQFRAPARRGRGTRRDGGQGRLGERPGLPLCAAGGLPPEPGGGAPDTLAACRVGLAGRAVGGGDRGEGHPEGRGACARRGALGEVLGDGLGPGRHRRVAAAAGPGPPGAPGDLLTAPTLGLRLAAIARPIASFAGRK